MTRPAGDCWPTPEQEWLLRAALLRGPAVTEAWARWMSLVTLEELDAGSARLLPQLYRNLLREGVTGPALPRLKGVYRHTWYKNHVVLDHVKVLLAAIQARGVPTMMLKGAALVLRYHGDFGARPMDDVDVLVPGSRVGEALGVLAERGFAPDEPLSPAKMRGYYGMNFLDAHDRNVDLHWRLLPGDPRPDDEFWARASTVDLLGLRVHVLDPADQLLHLFVNGVRWDPIPPLRWIADAAAVLDRAGPELDWQRLVTMAERHDVVLPVRHALEYLGTLLDVSLPATVIDGLRRGRASLRARLEYRVGVRARSASLGSLPEYWVRWLHMTGHQGPLARLVGFPGFLQEQWGCRSRSQLWSRVFVAAARRIRGIVRRHVWVRA